MHIKLTPTAVPNTDTETQRMVISGAMGTSQSRPAPPNRSRKRVRRDPASIGSFIQEQEEILQSSASIGNLDNENDHITEAIISDVDEPEADTNLSLGTQTVCTCTCSCSASNADTEEQPTQFETPSTPKDTIRLEVLVVGSYSMMNNFFY